MRGAYCTGSESHAKLVRALDKALAGSVGKNQPVRVRDAFRDRSTGVECRLASNSRTYARSTIKVSLVAALLYKNKRLTAKQKHWSRQAITVSSNPAADQLWAALGKHRGLQRFFTAAGLTHTSPPSGPRWGVSAGLPGASTQAIKNGWGPPPDCQDGGSILLALSATRDIDTKSLSFRAIKPAKKSESVV